MKNTEKTQRNEHRGLQKGGLKKWLSGFLAVSTVVTMLTGQTALFYGDELSSGYALAGEGSEEDITIHFGANEDTSISIHVNPENGEEDAAALAGLGSEMEGETDQLEELDFETETETENIGLEEVEAGDLVTISPADGSLLPEEAEANAEILTGRAENTAVKKVEEVAAVEPVTEMTGSTGNSTQDVTSEGSAAGESASETDTSAQTIGKTEYQAFEISLENVDEEQYQEGFHVAVSLPEDIKGRDFRLFHIHEGQEPVEIPIETVGKVDRKTGQEVVSGFEFQTDGFSEFVLQYTVDFHNELNGKTVEFSIPGGGFVSLEHVVEALGIASIDGNTEKGADNAENGDNSIGEVPGAEENGENGTNCEDAIKLNEVEVSEATKKFVADVESVEFSSPELVWVGKVNEAVTVGKLKEVNGLEVEYSSDLTEERIAEINAQTVETGDWALISLKPFDTEESLTVTMKDGEVFTIRVTDAQISTHVITADGQDYIITVTYGPEAEIPEGAVLEARELLQGDKEYEEHYSEMLSVLNNEALSDEEEEEDVRLALADMNLDLLEEGKATVPFVRFFDIKIIFEGEKIEPKAPVQVSITYNHNIDPEETAEAQIIHFAESGVELIDPEVDYSLPEEEELSSFTFMQSTFSVTGTLLKYTDTVPDGKYIILRGVGESSFYAINKEGNPVQVYRNNDKVTYPNVPDECVWTFRRNDNNGRYFIRNNYDTNYSMVLYRGITGNWGSYNQEIVVSTGNNKSTVHFKNPNGDPLKWDGNNSKFVLGNSSMGPDGFYLARVHTDVPPGRGHNLKPTATTELGDLSAWETKIKNSKILTEKTADVVDYDNRIYRIDLKALSDVTIITNKIDLELIVDTSRSMYFPATLTAVNNGYFTSTDNLKNNVVNSLDKNQIYYFIGDGEKATVYALYYAANGTNLNDYSRAQEWRYVDASFMNPPDAASMNESDRVNRLVGRNIEDLNYGICNKNRNGVGSRLFTSPDGITRLAYLKEAVRIASEIVYAVDKNNRIGLVTFNAEARPVGFFDYAHKSGLDSAIENISLAGGTRQDLGLQEGINLFTNNNREGAQKIAVLITDGAPNRTDTDSDGAWNDIRSKADSLKGLNSSNAKLYTLGLGLGFVGEINRTNLNGLASEEDNVTRHYNAENGPEIVTAVKNLIESLVYDVTLEAEVTDVVDPAFYPVDQSGNPIEPGTYNDPSSGKTYTWSKEQVNGAECWKITYINEDVGRGEKNADGTIKTPGWQKSFFIKAKEDFLGGNNIETNHYYKSSNRVKPTKYVYQEKGTNIRKTIDAPSNAPWGKFDKTPTVNVDELHLTEHSTEWTVYLGTTVTPEDQVKALWNEIKVKQVVKTGGTANNGTTITGGDKKWYPKTDTADTASPDNNYSSLPINRYFTDADFNALLNQLKTQNTTQKLIDYTAYGHQPGKIKVELQKEIIDGAVDAVGKAPGQHITDKDGSPAEKYTITVTYIPKTDNVANIGDPVTLAGEDKVESRNIHTINVVKKAIELTKVDADRQTITGADNIAQFTIYRRAKEGETQVTDSRLPDGAFTQVAVISTDSQTGKAKWDPIPAIKNADNTDWLENSEYYILETKAPGNYIAYDKNIPFKLTITSKEEPVLKSADGNTTLLYNVTQTPVVTVTGDSPATYILDIAESNNLVTLKVRNDITADLTIIKTDNASTPNNLGGAVFKLTKDKAIQKALNIVKASDGSTVVEVDQATGYFTIPKEGVIIKGLTANKENQSYVLTEVIPPDGYVITLQPIEFTINASGSITDKANSLNAKKVTFVNTEKKYTIQNEPGAVLPATGGSGTNLIYLIGLMFTACAGAGWMMRRRKKAA